MRLWHAIGIQLKLSIKDYKIRKRGNNSLFGGVSVVLGGDWRQTFPIVPHGSQVRQVKMSMKNSYLWTSFKQYKLTKNMRVMGSSRFDDLSLIHISEPTRPY